MGTRLSYTVDGLLVVCILVWLTTLPSMILSFLPILSVLQGTIQKLVNKIVGSHPFIQNFSLQHWLYQKKMLYPNVFHAKCFVGI